MHSKNHKETNIRIRNKLNNTKIENDDITKINKGLRTVTNMPAPDLN